MLTFIQRADLGNLEGQALEDATAQLVVIYLDGSPLPFDRHPKVNGPELADFAERLRGTLEQLKLPGNSGPRESGLMVSQELRHIMIWDPEVLQL